MDDKEDFLRLAAMAVAQNTIFSSMIHELRNDTTSIASGLAWLTKELHRRRDSHMEERVRHIARSVQDFEAILDKSARLLSRLSSRDGLPDLVDMREAAEDAISFLNLRPRVRVRLGHEGKALRCRVNCHVIANLLIGIFQNSLEAQASEITIVLSRHLGKEGEEVWVTISDDGSGIPSNLMSKVFDPFVTSKAGHPGLGLYLARQSLIPYGGSIRLESSGRNGTRVVVSIPLDGTPHSTEDRA